MGIDNIKFSWGELKRIYNDNGGLESKSEYQQRIHKIAIKKYKKQKERNFGSEVLKVLKKYEKAKKKKNTKI